jgi:type I restriction enzyme R subunit
MTQELSELESQFTDLALVSANFGFLLPYEPLLVLHGASCEARMFTGSSNLMGSQLAAGPPGGCAV